MTDLPVPYLVHGLLAFVALYWLASECRILPSPVYMSQKPKCSA